MKTAFHRHIAAICRRRRHDPGEIREPILSKKRHHLKGCKLLAVAKAPRRSKPKTRGDLESNSMPKIAKQSKPVIKIFNWIKKHAFIIRLCIFAIPAGYVGFSFFLKLAGVTIFPWYTLMPLASEAAHGAAITAAASWVVAIAAFCTFLFNREQKERIHKDEERRARDLAELQRIETEFAALAKDFASPDPLARINAAIGMGELAVKPDPRRLTSEDEVKLDSRTDGAQTFVGTKGELLPEPRAWPDEWRSRKTARNYPYFLRSVNRLVAATYMWENGPAQIQAKNVLQTLCMWAKDEGTDEPLLHQLINLIADANRYSFYNLKSLLSSALENTDREMLCTVFGITQSDPKFFKWQPFFDKLDERATSFSGNVSNFKDFMIYDEVTFDAELRSRAAILRQTRDMLANCLSYLSTPVDYPVELEHSIPHNLQLRDEIACVGYRRNLNLQLICLAGSRLSNVQLQGANLTNAVLDCSSSSSPNFSGAFCLFTSFTGVEYMLGVFKHSVCYSAQFTFGYLPESLFTSAECSGANFSECRLSKSDFTYANVSGASFINSVCNGSQFKIAYCLNAQFSGSICMNVNFSGSELKGSRFTNSKLFGSVFTDEDSGAARFCGGEWVDADYREHIYDTQLQEYCSTDNYDEALWNQLNDNFPSEPARLPPWQSKRDQD